jgi:hypothetical protein
MWIEWLKISSLILFNVFCFVGTILSLYLFFVVAKISRKINYTVSSFQEKIDNVETSISDWSWLAGPSAAILGGMLIGGKKKNWLKKLFEK